MNLNVASVAVVVVVVVVGKAAITIPGQTFLKKDPYNGLDQ